LAVRTEFWDCKTESAVMTFKALTNRRAPGKSERCARLMVCQSNRAVAALNSLTACATEYDRRVSPTVEQHNHLFRPAQALLDLIQQPARKNLLFPGLLEFVAHVHQLDFRQRTLLHAFSQFDERVFAALAVVVGFKRRRRRAEQHGSVAQFAAYDGNVATVIAGSFFLLIGRIVLLIHHHESEIADRSEDRGTRPNHHTGFAAVDAMPLLCPLISRKPGVQ